MQRFGNQQVEIAVVQLERREARVIVADVEGSAKRIVVFGDFAERRDFAFPALPHGLRLQLRANRVEAAAARIGVQKIGQFRLADDVHQEHE